MKMVNVLKKHNIDIVLQEIKQSKLDHLVTKYTLL